MATTSIGKMENRNNKEGCIYIYIYVFWRTRINVLKIYQHKTL